MYYFLYDTASLNQKDYGVFAVKARDMDESYKKIRKYILKNGIPCVELDVFYFLYTDDIESVMKQSGMKNYTII